MPTRPLLFLCSLLLTACTSEPARPVAPTTPPPATVRSTQALPAATLPAHMRELRGSLNTPPSGSEVEMALLVIDERDRPQRMLASLKLAGTGQNLAFHLPFDATHFPAGKRVELRARVSQAGRLILRLPPQAVRQAQSRDFGPLSLVNAP